MFVALLLSHAVLEDPTFRTLLALTPVVNGSIMEEEWLSLASSGNAKGFLQWEPGTLYLAGSADKDSDIVYNIDRDGNGWLVGKDNYELRFSFVEGKGIVTARQLDATKLNGPEWVGAETKGLEATFGTSGDRWLFEATLSGGAWGSASEGQRMAANAESLASKAATPPPYMPKTLSFFNLGFDLAEGLAPGAKFETSTKLREVAREDFLDVDFEVTGGGSFATSETRGEGMARASVGVTTRAFEQGDERNKTRIGYKSVVEPDAAIGWRILRTTVVDTKGNKMLLRTSFKVSDIVTLVASLPDEVAYSEAPQVVTGQLEIKSAAVGRVQGEYYMNVPAGWTIEKGESQKILIYNPRGREKINLRFVVPPKAAGTQELTFTLVVGDRIYTKVARLNIAKPG